MKKCTFMLVLFTILGLFISDLASARLHSRNHIHNGKNCHITATGVHQPVSYDRVFLDKLIKHDKKAIKEAQDIVNRADRKELKTAAQDIINSHTQEKERLELLRKEWFNN